MDNVLDKLKALLTAEVCDELVKPLEDLLEIEYAGWVKARRVLSEDEMAGLVRGKDILITSYDPITRKVIDASRELKLIVCTRANPVNVDTEYAKQKGIPVSYSPGRNSESAAEFTVALILAVTRKIPFAYRDLLNGEHVSEKAPENETKEGLRSDVTWSLGDDTPYVIYKGFQLYGRTLGVIGYGSIGRLVAGLCRAFGMKILVYDPFISEETAEPDVKLVSFDELLRQADVVTLHCKDTPQTRGIMNREAFGKMKKSAYFVNTSRGALVDEDALTEALLEHRIAGAALDVFANEPICKDHPFLTKCDNVLVTPHLAGATHDAIVNHTRQLTEDVIHFLSGEPLEYQYI